MLGAPPRTISLRQTFRYFVVVASLAAWQIQAGSAATFEGYARVGSQTSDVKLEILNEDRHSFRVICATGTEQNGYTRVALHLTDSSNTCLFQEESVLIPQDKATAWRNQLRSKFLSLVDTATFTVGLTETGILTCESRVPVELTDFLVGKVKLTYELLSKSGSGKQPTKNLIHHPELLRLNEIQVFSLEEWFNGFGDPVTLSLKQTISNTGGKPW